MLLSFTQRPEPEAIEVLPAASRTPDENGVLQKIEVEVPPFVRGCYFAAFQKYDPMGRTGGGWPNGTNRVQPLRVENFGELRRGGFFLLLELQDGEFLALLPMCGPDTATCFLSQDGTLQLEAVTMGTQPVEGETPLLSWARDADPYVACRRVWEAALAELGYPTRMREEKAYPDIFRFLGWCSWEEFRFDISEAVLLEALRGIEESGLPIRYFLVDDGHLDVVGDEPPRQRLRSFAPDAVKFPRGWKPLLDARQPDRVKWMGLWLNFNGYWAGIAPDNEMGELNWHLELAPSGSLVPRDGFGASFAFYDAMIGAARDAGFDFVKVDNQAANPHRYGGMNNPMQSAANNAQALETASARHMDGLINCMAHGPACIWNTRLSNVTRCSEDYLLGDEKRARRHLHNSYANIPWLGQTVWGDHDMFHSNDPASGALMARSKALSGGPIYLSDNPTGFDANNIEPLCLSDGQLLRPLAPAAPLPRSLFANPFEDGEPYFAIAPLANRCAALVAYNLTEPVVPVSGAIRFNDFDEAGCMLPEGRVGWAPQGDEGLVLYDWKSGQAQRLDGDFAFTLAGFDDLLALLCPLENGWAVIGRSDKFLAPAGVEVIETSEEELILRMVESGPLAIWNESETLSSPQLSATWTNDGGLWRCDLPVGQRDLVVRVRRTR